MGCDSNADNIKTGNVFGTICRVSHTSRRNAFRVLCLLTWCYTVRSDVANYPAGLTTSYFECSGAGVADLKAEVKSPSGRKEDAEIVETSENTFSIRFVPRVSIEELLCNVVSLVITSVIRSIAYKMITGDFWTTGNGGAHREREVHGPPCPWKSLPVYCRSSGRRWRQKSYSRWTRTGSSNSECTR